MHKIIDKLVDLGYDRGEISVVCSQIIKEKGFAGLAEFWMEVVKSRVDGVQS